MYNNTDIIYSFNLDNYINSLESDIKFNDYKLLVDNKDYNTLSIEHCKLMNEVNTMIKGNFRIVLCLGNEKYTTKDKDELFHTSNDQMKYLQGFFRNQFEKIEPPTKFPFKW